MPPDSAVLKVDLTEQASTAVVPYELKDVAISLEPRGLWLTAISLLASTAARQLGTVPPGLQPAAGMLALAHSAFNIYDCIEDWDKSWKPKRDCLIAAADVVMGSFVAYYKAFNIVPREVRFFVPEDITLYGIWDLSSHPSSLTHGIAHVAPVNESLVLGIYASKHTEDSSWLHAASFFREDLHTHNLLYRLAHASDLGRENDGTYHHLRLQSARYSTKKRAEGRNSGLVMDYLWENNNDEQEWSYFGGSGDGLGSTAAMWAERNNQEAFCVSPIVVRMTGSPGGGQCAGYQKEADGLMAYGWNNAAFNFDGRSGGWLDQCASAEVAC